MSYAIKFVNNEKIQYTKSFESAKALLCNVNDIFQDFIDSKLQVEEGTRIGKIEMQELFKAMYPSRFLTIAQIITSLKEKKITYNCDARVNGLKGAFINVTNKKENDPNDDTPPFKVIDTISYVVDTKKVNDEIEELEHKLELLKKKKHEIEVYYKKDAQVTPVVVKASKLPKAKTTPKAKKILNEDECDPDDVENNDAINAFKELF